MRKDMKLKQILKEMKNYSDGRVYQELTVLYAAKTNRSFFSALER